MVDTQLLEEEISKSGKKKSYLAAKCNCSVQSFRLKVQGKYEFSSSQVDSLCKELGVTSLVKKEKIFFKK